MAIPLAVQTYTPDRPDEGLPPVLLIHGLCSDGRRDWVETGTVAALTDAGRTVVVADLPGHGDSPAPAAAAEAGAGAIAVALLAALDGALAGTPGGTSGGAFDVVGYSLGARLAWELPEAAPGRVRRAVLGGLSPAEPFAAVDIEALRAAVGGGPEPADPFTAMFAGMLGAQGDRAAGLVTCVEGLRSTPFEPTGWAGRTPPVFIVGQDDMMVRGIERIVGLAGAADPVTVPGDHFQVLASAEFRTAVVKALTGRE
ncbi:alpha/beta fold hydrolase [Sphaerimonospora thailandensis]|uniref:Hydrolase n=1 Tax=Sphaerimonospora thailandensis TaxID=795644 RepID=A0A8J3RBV0_9ACTN|nr:alpha/beta fold hydrolase [Sphaerimonospora thailandensis]GIH71965.1 hydrolase [Sphaerimonospora thailandensis]